MKLNHFRQRLILALCCLTVISAPSFSQTTRAEKRANRDIYLLPSAGFTIFHFADFATSPLSYLGSGVNMGTGYLWGNKKSEHLFDASLMLGLGLSMAPLSNYFNTSTSSMVAGLSLYDHQLFQILEGSLPEFLNLKLGGALTSTSYFRYNDHLMNNGLGLESLLNLMLAAKIKADVSRKSEQVIDLYLFKMKFKPVKRDLAFQCNIGLLNMNYRPGYAYAMDSEVIGSETNPISYLLNGHQWSVNGWRLNTLLEYSQYRPSGNGYKIACVWDAAFAPGKFEHFQIASHSIKFTYIINRK